MRIVTLENSGRIYTSQVYLVLGDTSRLEDVNTLVDVGQDPGHPGEHREGAHRGRQMARGTGGADAQPFRSLCAAATGSRRRSTPRCSPFLRTSMASMACCAMGTLSEWATRCSR